MEQQTMPGRMMHQPLLIASLLEHAARHHGEVEIVSRRGEGGLHRQTYRETAVRVRRLANALQTLGIGMGDRVGTLAWNGYRHFELYYAVSSSGAVLHTLNPRLHADQLAFIAQHAGDKVLFLDSCFVPLVEPLAARLAGIQAFVVMTDREHMPAASTLPNLLCYEELLAAESDVHPWPVLDENAASSLCYTSGTIGNPKGVLYSHRSTLLHAFSFALEFSLGAKDTVLPMTPMFHVNAWGIPYVCCLVGAKLVLPGPQLDGASIYALMESEGVTFALGVPTVWQGLLSHLDAKGLGLSTLERTLIGGAACPASLIRRLQQTYGVRVIQAWGMTETSPVAAVGKLRPAHEALTEEQRIAVQVKQGSATFGVEMKIAGEDGGELPWDGRASGELLVRGPWVLSSYFDPDPDRAPDVLIDGWFPTGDVATIDSGGYMHITDRAKDLIKSGGEWIGSIELENIATAHPGVAMAACIAIPHPKWQERPLLVVVRRPGAEVTREELLTMYEGKVAKWWIPDDVVFVEAIPLGGTGKMLKTRLREQFKDHVAAD